jgi:hypothetical protein
VAGERQSFLPAPAAAGRTVVDIAEHFEGLKKAAVELRGRFGARRRGYFTPAEDEEARHLLVSYCRARAALLELVVSIQDELAGGEPCPERGRGLFLIGYAGAIVLVDAARSLRELFHDSAVVRAKLNEPEPHFGIAAGTYDAVQKSLTAPLHAWHLHHANRHWEAERAAFEQAAAGDPVLAPVLAVVERLGHRVRVAPRRYARACARVRARRLFKALPRSAFEAAVHSLEQAICCLVAGISTRPRHRPALPPGIAEQVRALLEPGDILITRKEHAATNYFLPGYWPHAALFLGDGPALARLGLDQHQNVLTRWRRLLELDPGEPRRVLEALKDGVLLRSLASPFASDALAVVRPSLPEDAVASALARALFHEGKPYDFDFDFSRSDRLVCTEVVYRAYDGIGGIHFPLTRRLGRFNLSAEDILRLAVERLGFEPVAVFCPRLRAALLNGEEAAGALRATIGL